MVVVTAEELEIAVKREVAIVVPVVVVVAAAAAVVDWVFGKAAVDLYWKDLC